MNIERGPTTPDLAASTGATFEEVDVPAIQKEIQERRLEKLSPDSLFSPDVVEPANDNGSVYTSVSQTSTATPKPHPFEVIETTPGRPDGAY